MSNQKQGKGQKAAQQSQQPRATKAVAHRRSQQPVASAAVKPATPPKPKK